MRLVREVILGADKRMAEIVQYGTVQFVYKSPLGGFVQVKNQLRRIVRAWIDYKGA